jgi:drug/metabolite transporter (DMT)-like permease
MKMKLRGSISLLAATVIWGSAFIAQSVGMDYIEPFTFQAVRCFLAVLFLLPVIWLFDRDKKSYFMMWSDPHLWKTGLVCGIALFVAAGLQQIGLVYTTAGKAGFITAMYIVLVPILGLFFRKVPSPAAWVSVGLAVVGLYMLSCVGVTEINIGDICLLGCALGFAVQITLVDRMAANLDGLPLNCIQSLVCAVLSMVMMMVTESPKTEDILACWLPLGYAGVLSMGVAYSLQIIGQKHVEPTPASLIMSMESVFAMVFGWLLLNESMAVHELIGCALVFAAVILSQIPIKTKKHA